MGGKVSKDRSDAPLLNPYTTEFEDISRENNFSEWYYNISNRTTSVTYINQNRVANIYRFGHPNYRANSEVYQKKSRNPRPITWIFKDHIIF